MEKLPVYSGDPVAELQVCRAELQKVACWSSDGGQTGMDEAARSAAAARWDRICFHYGLVGWKTGGRTQDPAWNIREGTQQFVFLM